jgi:hypothetical protein
MHSKKSSKRIRGIWKIHFLSDMDFLRPINQKKILKHSKKSSKTDISMKKKHFFHQNFGQVCSDEKSSQETI